MKLEQKILDAKVEKRKQFVKAGVGFITLSVLCAWVVVYISGSQFNIKNTEIEVANDTTQLQGISDEQLRQTYINTLSDYENNLEPELNKIDLIQWNKPLSDQLAALKDKALVGFTTSNYIAAASNIEKFKQLAKTTITDSQKAFDQALPSAQKAYDEDLYEEAKLQITQAQMLDNTSDKATNLAAKIDQLPEILSQLEKINTAKVENNLNKELKLIKELLKIVPDRTSASKRKQVLVNTIKQRNFNASIAKAYQALKQDNTQAAKQKIDLAKKIFPNRQEIADATEALKKLEKKQRFKMHQQKVQLAIASDDWVFAKKQAILALQEQAEDAAMQNSLTLATTIIDFNTEFKQQIKSPYHLSKKQLASSLNNKISQASAFSHLSPSLGENIASLSHLIKVMNKKVAVNVTSDNQTTILVRGVGIVGETLSKTIQLLPGKYTFEGKRKGFKSKLINVLISYDKADFQVSIRCDEPI